ncbi:MAG: hypothetical protein ACTHJ3_14490 [Pararhizobium sp.]
MPPVLTIPLMIIPFVLYNLASFGLIGEGRGLQALDTPILRLPMLSGSVWTMSFGDLLIVVALFVLFIEILKATRMRSAVLDHIFSTILFIAFLVEFLLMPGAASHVFFILMAIAFVDVIAGFSVSIRSAGRDVSIGL